MLIVSEVRILGWFLGIFNNFFAGWKPALQGFCRLEACGPGPGFKFFLVDYVLFVFLQ